MMKNNLLDEHLIPDDDIKHYSMYHQYEREEDIRHVMNVFKQNNIPYKAKKNEQLLDSIIIGQGLTYKYWIEIPRDYFIRANTLLLKEANAHYENIDIEGHHLNDMNDEELKEILVQPNEWSVDAVVVAKKILAHRGVPISDEKIQEEIQARNKAMKQPRKGNPIIITIYFIVAILSGYFVMPIGAVAIWGMGYYYAFYKKTTPDGEKQYEFDKPTRNWGVRLLLFAILMFIIGVVRVLS